MIILPAIDIIDGKVVRLRQGDYAQVKTYAATPFEAAANFCEQGATHLHVVDLDGAKRGKADNAGVIEKIICRFNLSVEVGGGIRTLEQIKKYVDCGVDRVILGTVAVKNLSFVERAVAIFGDKISVGVDADCGKVAVNGWTESTDIDSLCFCRKLKELGVNNIIYTDISKDGMMSGTNIEIYKVLCQTLYPKITASGGICSLKEVKILKDLGIYGAILGKALYEGKIDLKSAIITAE